MGKRAAAAPAKGRTPAKAARPDPKDAFARQCAPLLKFISSTEAGGLSGECREMLMAAAPLALKTAKEERHDYQVKIIDSVAALVTEARALRQKDVDEAQAHAATVDQEESGALAELDTALDRAGKKAEVKEARSATHTSVQEEETAKRAELQESVAKEEALAAEKKTVADEREEFEGLVPQWDELEASNYQGREWRARDKLIAHVMKAFARLELPVSLMDALPVALKQKVDARGKFALTALEHGKAALKGHIDSLGARISNFETEAEECAAAVAAAKEAVAAAEAATAEATQASIDAENDWVTEASAVNELKVKLKSFAPRKAEAAAAVAKVSKQLQAAVDLTETFKSLAEPAPLEPPAQAEEAAARDAAAQDASGGAAAQEATA